MALIYQDMSSISKRAKQTEEAVKGEETTRGDWRTHVFIPTVQVDASAVDTLKITSHFPSSAKPIDYLHVSLSKAVSLSKHEIDVFRTRLGERLRLIECFTIGFDGDVVLLDGEDAEVFGGLTVSQGIVQLGLLVDAVDDVMEQLGKDKYYAERIHHVSICAWPNHSAPDFNAPESLEELGFRAVVNCIVIRSGHHHFEVPLRGNIIS